MQRFALAVAAVLSTVAGVGATLGSRETARLEAAARVVQDAYRSIPADAWNRAQCVAVFTRSDRVASAGSADAPGVMSCRAGDKWSAPAFVRLENGHLGERRAARNDLLLLVMNEQGAQKLLQDRARLSAAEVQPYSREHGIVSPFDMAGAVLRYDAAANSGVYGKGASPKTILASRELSAPIEAQWFLRALNAQPAVPASHGPSDQRTGTPSPEQARDTASSARPSAPAADDLRARVAEIQQALDRVLSDTTPAPVGTSGTSSAASGTVAVDRSRLLQMREQLDALLAALNRR